MSKSRVDPLPMALFIAAAAVVFDVFAILLLPPLLARVADADTTTVAWIGSAVISDTLLLAALVIAAKIEGRQSLTSALGLRPFTLFAREARSRWKVGAPLTIVLLAAYPVGAWATNVLWRRFPGPEWSPNNPALLDDFPIRVTVGIILVFILVRIPLIAVVEEAAFRGFIQARLPVAAPVLSGILFGLFHLGEWWVIPQTMLLGVVLGVLRWWTGSIWLGAVAHYAGNVLFVLRLM